MKKGKDDEKSTVPLFPRLHLNDAEKGGPRAPPRNKMALYEQLSIPSQRFKQGAGSINSNNTASMTPPPTSSEGSSLHTSVLFSVPSSASRPLAEQSDNHFSDSEFPRVHPQMEKKSKDDDFSVPLFLQDNLNDDFNRYRSNNNGDTLIQSTQAYTQHSTVHLPTGGNEPKTQEWKSQNIRENVEEFMLNNQKSVKSISIFSSANVTELSGCQSDEYACGELGGNSLKDSSMLLKADLNLLSEHKVGRHSTSRALRDGVVLNIESREDGKFGSLPVETADVASEISMVDCVSGSIISPDDIVNIIGQKHFWKARKAIVNQQRIFAFQVFELHRLIEVQKLMAGSPDLLHNSSLLGKSTKSSSTKRPPDVIKLKNCSNKPNHRMECSAENNVVDEEFLSSEQSGGVHEPISKLSSVNSVNPSDNVPSSWCQTQMQGHHQWLIPVMSPSEGLVYKPYYPSPGMLSAPFCGGCGPPRTPPKAALGYGSVACQQFQGMSFPPFAFQAGPQGFLPPPTQYANLPITSHHHFVMGSDTDQTNHLATSGLLLQPPLTETNNQYHHSDVQASTTERSERGQVTARGNGSSGASNTNHQHVVDRPTAQVIKSVPRGGVSATESAARIFQSIQQERKRRRT